MLEWAVIADDLTGAADTGVQFLPVAAPVLLVDHRRLHTIAPDAAPPVLAVFTSSRALPADAARRAAAAAARSIRRLGTARIYKKIDSSLRGNIGPELEGVMRELGTALSFIAPAFPQQGRTTVAGIHRIDGVPVADSEMGRDPVTPVTESSVPKWIAAQTAGKVGHVGLEALAGGMDAAAHRVDCLLARGVVHVVFDAAEAAHLDLVARLALERFTGALVCGSAGLARCLVDRLMASSDPTADAAPPATRPARGGVLFVCGSASERLRVQADRLTERAGVAQETLDPESLLEDAQAAAAALSRTAAALARGDLVMRISPPGRAAPAADPQRLVAALADLAAAVAQRTRAAGLFLSGGDTAVAVLERLEVSAVRLERELASGLGCGVIIGGPMAGRLVITKAGSFGGPDTLLDVYRLLRPQAAV